MSPTHHHGQPHETRPDAPDHLTYYQAMEVAVRELLIEKGVLTADGEVYGPERHRTWRVERAAYSMIVPA